MSDDLKGWVRTGEYQDILYETWDGIAKITINRPEVRNAFRPTTVFELGKAFEAAREDATVGVVILTGAGTEAFCSGGDQRVRGDDGYVDPQGVGRLNILDVQIQIRRLPKPVIAMVAGYEIWFLCEQYDAQQALDMGLVNKVVPLADIEKETVAWCRRILELSPLALRMIKAGMNAADDGLAGIQQLAGDATLLFYMSEESQEGRNAYVQKRKPNFAKFPKRP